MTGAHAAIVVYGGPSLPAESPRLLAADYRPPVRRGDLDGLLGDPPAFVGIVDGLFFQSLAVSPKEILELLRAGVRVYGSSSIGALRAVELEPFGMRGVGAVFRAYRSGRLDADDEVAMAYSPDGRQARSVAQVTIRHLLGEARRRGVIDAREAALLARVAKALYFPDRTFDRVLREARGRVGDRALRRVVALVRGGTVTDPKVTDATALLREIRREAELAGVLPDPA